MGGTSKRGGETDGVAGAVLVVDRRRAFAEALAELLTGAGFRAASAPYEDACESCSRLRPATLLVDGDPPFEAALGVVRAAREAREGGRVLALVESTGRAQVRLIADIGADGAVSRQAQLEDVVAAIRGESSRSRPSGRGPRGSRNGGQTSNPLDRLTPRERQVLRALMVGSRSAAIAEALGISPHTVRTHVQNTFAKLAVSTRLEAASLAREAGLRPLTLGEGEEASG